MVTFPCAFRQHLLDTKDCSAGLSTSPTEGRNEAQHSRPICTPLWSAIGDVENSRVEALLSLGGVNSALFFRAWLTSSCNAISYIRLTRHVRLCGNVSGLSLVLTARHFRLDNSSEKSNIADDIKYVRVALFSILLK